MPEHVPSEIFQRSLQVNVLGTWHCCQEVGCRMLADGRGGSIVTVASIAGVGGQQNFPVAYQAGKAAIVNLTRNLACSWADRGVRVNALAPGWFPSEMTDPWLAQPIWRQRVERQAAMGRIGEPAGARRTAPLPRLIGIELRHRPHAHRGRRRHRLLRGPAIRRTALRAARRRASRRARRAHPPGLTAAPQAPAPRRRLGVPPPWDAGRLGPEGRTPRSSHRDGRIRTADPRHPKAKDTVPWGSATSRHAPRSRWASGFSAIIGPRARNSAGSGSAAESAADSAADPVGVAA